MAGHHNHPAQQLMKKGKLQLAAFIKSDYSSPFVHSQLNALLDYILDPQKPVDDSERVDWCRMIMAGGVPFDTFADTVRSYDDATMCGFVWTSDYVAYRCRTCGLSPCMSLCSDCFLSADHTGHDFNMFRSQAGGACDCGDASVMKTIGFCTKHRPDRASKLSAPQELLGVARLMMPRLVCRLVQHYRDLVDSAGPHGAYKVQMPETECFLDFLQHLSDMGAAMRAVITKSIIDPILYRTFKEGSIGTAGSQSCYQDALRSLGRVPVPEEFTDVLGSEMTIFHEHLLDEMFFWVLKSEFPQKPVTLLLSMLPDEIYKDAFVTTFVKHYDAISTSLVATKDKPRMSNCVVHISVQLLSPVSLATRMVIDQNLLYVMLSSLMHMLTDVLMHAGGSDESRHFVVDCTLPVMKEHSYWPIVSDIINVFSHRSIAIHFMSNKTLLTYWARLVACFQGMNLNVRELGLHVEYEPDGYYAAFSAELEICASPMWSLLQHLNDQSSVVYTKNVIEVVVETLLRWFSDVNLKPFQTPSSYHVSFHYPLHRYLSAFVNCAITKQGVAFEDLNLSQDLLHLLMIHPLQLLVGFHEIFAGVWVRNGLQIRGQAMTYLQCHFCNSTIDADFFLLQVISSNVDPDHFVRTVLERFHVLDVLTFCENEKPTSRPFLTREQQTMMLDSMLSFFCTLLTVRTYSGENSDDVTRQEMVSLLCMNDRTHSHLADAMPEKCGLQAQLQDFDSILREISEYKEPVFEVGGTLQQGRYVPRSSTWLNEYDPLHVLIRSLHRRDFQASIDRYSEHVKQMNLFTRSSNPWPPFRVPPPTHAAYAGLIKLLHCRTMHGLIFTLLYKAVNDVNIPDSVVYYTIFLLELSLTLPNPDVKKREILIKAEHVDKQFSDWFSSNNVFSNVFETIAGVDVSFYRVKDVVDMTLDVDSSLPPKHDHLQMDLSSLEALDPSWAVVQVEEEEEEEEEEEAAAAAATLTTLALPDLTTFQYFDPLVPVLSLPTNEMDVVPGNGSGAENSPPKFRNRGVNAILDREVVTERVPVDESIASLLLKLYAKLASTKGAAYASPAPDSPEMSGSRVGDGQFFVGAVLDRIGRHDDESRRRVAALLAKLSPKSGSESATPKNDHEERRRKAKQRQERLMKEFASKQKQFMEKVIGPDVETESMDACEGEEAVKQTTYDCCICSQTTPSTDDRPVGLTVLVQPTSVLGHQRHSYEPVPLRLSEPASAPIRINNLSKEFRQRVKRMKYDFEEESWILGINSGWENGVHAQTCGHYLHLDCHRSYISSLKSQSHQQAQILQVSRGEFWCPMCRQLSNTVLPIPRSVGPAALVRTVPVRDREVARHVAELLRSVSNHLPDCALLNAMKSAMTDVMNISPQHLRTFSKGNQAANFIMFVGSILRSNIEMELIQRMGSPCLTSTLPSNFTQKKSCIPFLYHVLSVHYKILSTKPSINIWSHVTGIMLEEQSTSLSIYTKELPLFLKEPLALFTQIVLGLPPAFDKKMYQCVVQAFYNVQLVQAVAAITCRFSSSEHEAWRSKGRTSSCSRLEELVSQVIECLGRGAIYDDEYSESHMPAICQSVWTPMSVEELALEHVLPFMRVASQLQRHLLDDEEVPLLKMPDNVQEFQILSTYLGLAPISSAAAAGGASSSVRSLCSSDCLNWVCDEPRLLVDAWCRDLVQAIGEKASAYRPLLTLNPTWFPPRLLALPKHYDQIFQLYRKKNCPECKTVPKFPALCLVCSQLVCYKQDCCLKKETMECVQHSVDCGSGTAMYLLVNSSVIIIIRGPRAAIWGSVYLDKHGEEDRDLKRGKPLELNEERYRLLHQLWISHNFDHVCKQWILHGNQM